MRVLQVSHPKFRDLRKLRLLIGDWVGLFCNPEVGGKNYRLFNPLTAVTSLSQQIKIGLGIAVLASAAGCVGYVDGGYGGAVVVPGPVFYGGFEARPVVRVYSDRGYRSRGVAHPGRSDRR